MANVPTQGQKVVIDKGSNPTTTNTSARTAEYANQLLKEQNAQHIHQNDINQENNNSIKNENNINLYEIFENLIKKKSKRKGYSYHITSIPKIIEIINQSLEDLDIDVNKSQNAHGLNDVLNALNSLLASSKGDQIAILKSGSITNDDTKKVEDLKLPKELINNLKNEIKQITCEEDEEIRKKLISGFLFEISQFIDGKDESLSQILSDLSSNKIERVKIAKEKLLKIALESNEDERLLLKDSKLVDILNTPTMIGPTIDFIKRWINCDNEIDSKRLAIRKKIDISTKEIANNENEITNDYIELLMEYSFIAKENNRQGLISLFDNYPEISKKIKENTKSSSCKYLTKWLDEKDEKKAEEYSVKKIKEIKNKKLKDKFNIESLETTEDLDKAILSLASELSELESLQIYHATSKLEPNLYSKEEREKFKDVDESKILEISLKLEELINLINDPQLSEYTQKKFSLEHDELLIRKTETIGVKIGFCEYVSETYPIRYNNLRGVTDLYNYTLHQCLLSKDLDYNITQYLNDEIHEQLFIGNAEAKENINKISNTENEFYKKDFSLCIASASINHIQFCLPEGDINQFEKNAPQIGENRFKSAFLSSIRRYNLDWYFINSLEEGNLKDCLLNKNSKYGTLNYKAIPCLNNYSRQELSSNFEDYFKEQNQLIKSLLKDDTTIFNEKDLQEDIVIELKRECGLVKNEDGTFELLINPILLNQERKEFIKQITSVSDINSLYKNRNNQSEDIFYEYLSNNYTIEDAINKLDKKLIEANNEAQKDRLSNQISILKEIQQGATIPIEYIDKESKYLAFNRSEFLGSSNIINEDTAINNILSSDFQFELLLQISTQNDNMSLCNNYHNYSRGYFKIKSSNLYFLMESQYRTPLYAREIRNPLTHDEIFSNKKQLYLLNTDDHIFSETFNDEEVSQWEKASRAQYDYVYEQIINIAKKYPQIFGNDIHNISEKELALKLKLFIDGINNNEEKIQKLHQFLVGLGNLGKLHVNILQDEFYNLNFDSLYEKGKHYTISTYIGKQLGEKLSWYNDLITIFSAETYNENLNKTINSSEMVSSQMFLHEDNRALGIAMGYAELIVKKFRQNDQEMMISTLREILNILPPKEYIDNEVGKLSKEDEEKYNNALKIISEITDDNNLTLEQDNAINLYISFQNKFTESFRKDVLEKTSYFFKSFTGKDLESAISAEREDLYSHTLNEEVKAIINNNIEEANFLNLIRGALQDNRRYYEESNLNAEEFIFKLRNYLLVNGEIDEKKLNDFHQRWKKFFGEKFSQTINEKKLEAFNDYSILRNDRHGNNFTDNYSRENLRNILLEFDNRQQKNRIEIDCKLIEYYSAQSGKSQDAIISILSDLLSEKDENTRIEYAKQICNILKIKVDNDKYVSSIEKYLKDRKAFTSDPLYTQVTSLFNKGEICDAVKVNIALFRRWKVDKDNLLQILENCEDIDKLIDNYKEFYNKDLSIVLDKETSGLTKFKCHWALNPPKTIEEKLQYARERTKLDNKSVLWFGDNLNIDLKELEEIAKNNNQEDFNKKFEQFVQKANTISNNKEALSHTIKQTATVIVVGGTTIICFSTGVGAPMGAIIISGTSLTTRAVISYGIEGSGYELDEVGNDILHSAIDGASYLFAAKTIGLSGFERNLNSARSMTLCRSNTFFAIDTYLETQNIFVDTNPENLNEQLSDLINTQKVAVINSTLSVAANSLAHYIQSRAYNKSIRNLYKSAKNDENFISHNDLFDLTGHNINEVTVFRPNLKLSPKEFEYITKRGYITFNELKKLGYLNVKGNGRLGYAILSCNGGTSRIVPIGNSYLGTGFFPLSFNNDNNQQENEEKPKETEKNSIQETNSNVGPTNSGDTSLDLNNPSNPKDEDVPARVKDENNTEDTKNQNDNNNQNIFFDSNDETVTEEEQKEIEENRATIAENWNELKREGKRLWKNYLKSLNEIVPEVNEFTEEELKEIEENKAKNAKNWYLLKAEAKRLWRDYIKSLNEIVPNVDEFTEEELKEIEENRAKNAENWNRLKVEAKKLWRNYIKSLNEIVLDVDEFTEEELKEIEENKAKNAKNWNLLKAEAKRLWKNYLKSLNEIEPEVDEFTEEELKEIEENRAKNAENWNRLKVEAKRLWRNYIKSLNEIVPDVDEFTEDELKEIEENRAENAENWNLLKAEAKRLWRDYIKSLNEIVPDVDEFTEEELKEIEENRAKNTENWNQLKVQAKQLWRDYIKSLNEIVLDVDEFTEEELKEIEENRAKNAENWNRLKVEAKKLWRDYIKSLNEIVLDVDEFTEEELKEIEENRAKNTENWNQLKVQAKQLWRDYIKSLNEIVPEVDEFTEDELKEIEENRAKNTENWNQLKVQAKQLWRNYLKSLNEIVPEVDEFTEDELKEIEENRAKNAENWNRLKVEAKRLWRDYIKSLNEIVPEVDEFTEEELKEIEENRAENAKNWNLLKAEAKRLWRDYIKSLNEIVPDADEFTEDELKEIEENRAKNAEIWNRLKVEAKRLWRDYIKSLNEIVQDADEFTEEELKEIEENRAKNAEIWNRLKVEAKRLWRDYIKSLNEIVQDADEFTEDELKEIEENKAKNAKNWNLLKAEAKRLWRNYLKSLNEIVPEVNEFTEDELKEFEENKAKNAENWNLLKAEAKNQWIKYKNSYFEKKHDEILHFATIKEIVEYNEKAQDIIISQKDIINIINLRNKFNNLFTDIQDSLQKMTIKSIDDIDAQKAHYTDNEIIFLIKLNNNVNKILSNLNIENIENDIVKNIIIEESKNLVSKEDTVISQSNIQSISTLNHNKQIDVLINNTINSINIILTNINSINNEILTNNHNFTNSYELYRVVHDQKDSKDNVNGNNGDMPRLNTVSNKRANPNINKILYYEQLFLIDLLKIKIQIDIFNANKFLSNNQDRIYGGDIGNSGDNGQVTNNSSNFKKPNSPEDDNKINPNINVNNKILINNIKNKKLENNSNKADINIDILSQKLFKEIKENINQIKDIFNLSLESNIDRYKTDTNKFSTISSENLNITNINGKQEPILLNNNSNNVSTEKELLNCVEKIIYNNVLNIPESTDNISINYKNEKLENFINIIVSQVILNKDDSIIYEKSINESNLIELNSDYSKIEIIENNFNTKNTIRRKSSRNFNLDKKLFYRNIREIINLLILFNKLNIDLSLNIQRKLFGQTINLNDNNINNIFYNLYKNRLKLWKNLNTKKAYKKLLKLRIYETQRYLILMLLQILSCSSGLNDDKKVMLYKFLSSLSPEIKKFIKLDVLLKKLQELIKEGKAIKDKD